MTWMIQIIICTILLLVLLVSAFSYPMFVRLRQSRWINAHMKDPDATHFFRQHLKCDSNWKIRAAATALCTLKDAGSLTDLIALLSHKDSSIRISSISALGEIGSPEAVEDLVKRARASDIISNVHVIRSLAKIGGEKSNRFLVAVLIETDRDAVERQEAVRALESIGGAESVGHIVEALRDDVIGRAAYEALNRLNWKPKTLKERLRFEAHNDSWGSSKERLSIAKEVIEWSDESLIDDLCWLIEKHGDLAMAEMYLNSDHPRLSHAGIHWANSQPDSIFVGFNTKLTSKPVPRWRHRK
jgi:hypothetical protein